MDNIAGWKSWHGPALLMFHRCIAILREGSSSGWKLKPNKRKTNKQQETQQQRYRADNGEENWGRHHGIQCLGLEGWHCTRQLWQMHTYAHICAEARGENISGLLWRHIAKWWLHLEVRWDDTKINFFAFYLPPCFLSSQCLTIVLLLKKK